MEDMYDKIRDKINNPPEMQATEQDWKSFQSYRSTKDGGSSKKTVWPYWVVGSLLFLLGLSNLYWINKNSEYTAVNSSHSNTIDTVYITKYVDDYDVKTVADIHSQKQLNNVTAELALIKSQYQNLKFALDNQKTRLTQLQISKDLLETKYGSLQKQWNTNYATNQSLLSERGKTFLENGQTIPFKFDNTVEERILLSIIGKLPEVVLDQISYQRARLFHPSEIITIKNKRPFNLFEAITPKSFSINANMGYVFGPSEDGGKGFAGDLRATTLFSKSVRGYIGISHASIQSRIEDNITGVPYPMLPEGDEIEHTDEKLTQTSANIGLEYLLNIDGRWRPFVGFGYGKVLSNNSKYSFEIEASNGNEYYIAPEDRISLDRYDELIFTFGSDFNLSSRFDIRLGVNYTYALQNIHNSNFLLKGGAYYHF